LGNYRGAGFRKCKSCHGVLLDKKNLNFIMGGRTGGSKYPFLDAGVVVLDGLATADAFAALLGFVLDIVGGALSA
jgi:hypothetical protein